MKMINSYASIFSKFISVGLVATAIHALIYAVMSNWLLIHPHLANFQGYLCAVLFSYFAQMTWTFSSRDPSKRSRSFSKFIVTSLIGFILNALFVLIVKDMLDLHANYALIGIIFVTPLLSFVLLNYWVFPETKKNTGI